MSNADPVSVIRGIDFTTSPRAREGCPAERRHALLQAPCPAEQRIAVCCGQRERGSHHPAAHLAPGKPAPPRCPAPYALTSPRLLPTLRSTRMAARCQKQYTECQRAGPIWQDRSNLGSDQRPGSVHPPSCGRGREHGHQGQRGEGASAIKRQTDDRGTRSRTAPRRPPQRPHR